MNTKTLNLWRRVQRLATTFAALALVSACVVHAQAPSAQFQNSAVTSSSNTINATRVPVVISPTLTVYVDLALKFDVDLNGNLTIASGYPQVTPSPVLLTGNFKPGTYIAPSTMFDGKGIITINSPGVTDGGATMWTLSVPTGTSRFTNPTSATWYVGPLDSSPYADRIKKAGLTSTAWSYGIGGGWGWSSTSLLGFSQTGNAITIVNFSNGNDQKTPQDQVTYTLVQ